MTRKASEPLQRELYAAYKAGVSLDQYVEVYGFVENHLATIALLARAADLHNDHMDCSAYLQWIREHYFDTGRVKGRDAGEAAHRGLDVMGYLQFSALGELSHEMIINAMQTGITAETYSACRQFGATLEQIKHYSREFGEPTVAFHYYAEIRSRDISMEHAKRLTTGSGFDRDIGKLLDIGATPEELISILEGESARHEACRDKADMCRILGGSPALWHYRSLRLHYNEMTHEVALEAAEQFHADFVLNADQNCQPRQVSSMSQ